jgi:hypothetical protein
MTRATILPIHQQDLEIAMILRGAALAATLLASGISLASAEEPAPTLEMSAVGEVQIAADGHVSDYRPQSQLAPMVASLVDRSVRNWRFEPIIVDGSPVVAKTSIRLQLRAEPVAGRDGYTVRVVNIWFGGLTRKGGMKPAHYPKELVIAHVGAKVVMALRVDETGNVLEAQAYQTSLDRNDISDFDAQRYRHILEQASLEAAKNWHYDPSESIGGKSVGSTVIVPIAYSLCQMPCGRAEGKWKAYYPGPVHPAPWIHDGQLADHQELSSLEDGQALSLDSRFHLKDNVVGKTL